MKKVVLLTLVAAMALSCGGSGVAKYTFDSSKSIDSHEFSLSELGLKDVNDWNERQYMVLEIKSSTAQRFLLGIDTDNGLHEKRTHVLPGVWVRLCIPLDYYRQKPTPSSDLAATVNKPQNGVGFQHIEGGSVGPLTGVKGLSIKYYTPLENPTVEIRSISLTDEYQTPTYLGDKPFVDEFGQWNLAEFKGKVHNEEELKNIWQKEDESIKANPLPRSEYGGFLDKNVGGTGFFRVQKIDGRWWFVDPDGYLFLSVSGGGPMPGGGGEASKAKGLEKMFAQYPPETEEPLFAGFGDKQQKRMMSFGEWNLHRRYGFGDNWRDLWADMAVKRMQAWGLNTGSPRPSSFPYLGHLRSRVETIYGIQDVYAEGYADSVDADVKGQVEKSKDDPFLLGYFLQNEPSWLEIEPRVCQLLLDDTADRPIKVALTEYLKRNGDTPESRTKFIHETFRKHIATLSGAIRKYDPNHLILGIRFGHSAVPAMDILQTVKDYSDVYAFNTYRIAPNKEYLDAVFKAVDMPMINGEFHFGTIDRGMAPGLVQVANQEERATAFRYFAENAFSHPALVGIAWFQYTDQGLMGRRDGERYNIGFVDVTDQPYPIVKGIRATAEDIYKVHSGLQSPFDTLPKGLQGNEDDLISKSNQ